MKRLLRWALAFSFVINLLWLAPAMFSLQVFDRVLTSQSKETLLVLVLGLCIAFALTGVLEYLRGRLQGVLGSIVNDALAPEIARLTLVEAAKRQGPVPMEPLRDVARLRNLFSAQGVIAVLDAPWALVFIGVIALAHPWLGVGAAAAGAVMLAFTFLNDRLTRKSIEEVQSEAGKSQRYLEQAMSNSEAAQALGMSDSLVARWQQMSMRLADLQGPVARRAVAMSSFIRVLRQGIQVLLQALGAYLVLDGQASPGVMVASTMLLGRALAPIEQMVASWKVLAEGRLAYQRLNPMLKQVMGRQPPMQLPAPTGQLTAAGLVYRPARSDRMIVAGISLQLATGESLAIIGPSGSGKSTLVRLLIGLWAPAAGVVRLDGVDLSKWGREQVGPHIGYVPQDVELFAGTVADNIARLGPVDSDLVVEAAKLAGVHEMILGLPEGYDTEIDPHAALLSPGQRQRIAVARALFGSPRLVVMDEPNSNLDGAGELALAETLKQLRGNTTVIVVTHRATLTAHVDKILVVEAGRATHFGPARDVLQALSGGARPMPAGGGPAVAPPQGVSRPAAPAAPPSVTYPGNEASTPAASNPPMAQVLPMARSASGAGLLN
ncbi:type I secretion system permease/ATPase [Sphaerotilus microaerophilus]|uniref:Peptide ABC transporter n=1 Tax=Sphaerotilus microaerophilus TaxID=2914710 RepID=A0ABN6PJ02_9BURK|nr:type I secretion system permease/ATPase [Sphaerotilus sp. FB-5]BDI04958.1 peptide ABC transporter [Sphaerotilus sp. FB-5]